jgi:hypothetical protein
MFEKGEMDWVLSPLNHLVLEKNDLRPIALFSMHAMLLLHGRLHHFTLIG